MLIVHKHINLCEYIRLKEDAYGAQMMVLDTME